MARETWIDTAKGVAIFLVVLGHTIRGIIESGTDLGWVWLKVDTLIYAFHMPLFFALSGWFYIRMVSRENFSRFAFSRIERLAYPMVLWTYIFFFVKLLAGEFSNSPIDLGDFPAIPFPGVLHFWFIWDLLILSLAFYPIKFLVRKGSIPFLVMLILIIICVGLRFLPLSPTTAKWIGSAIYNAVFFMAGVALSQLSYLFKPRFSSLFGFALVFGACLAAWPIFENANYSFVGSLVLVICALGFIRDIDYHFENRLTAVFSLIGTASLTIYVTHTIFSAGVREVLFALGADETAIHLAAGVLVGVLGPMTFLFYARRLGAVRALGLGARTSSQSASIASKALMDRKTFGQDP